MGPVTTFHDEGFALQPPFEAAVITATILRPSLKRALLSVFRQTLPGRIQVLVGIDKPLGDRRILDEALAHRPPNVAVTLVDLGYSTSARHGGQHPDLWGGALVTIMGYMANSPYLAYLGDDNWMEERHLDTLRRAIAGQDWAYSLRWYVEEGTGRPLCIDRWESVGPGRGVFAERFGGWVDPNCMMLDKRRCEPVLRHRALRMQTPWGEAPSDRAVFDQLRHRPSACTGEATSFYKIQSSDPNHGLRLEWIRQSQAAGDAAPPPAN